MNKNLSHFFDKYQSRCEEFHGSPIHIPKPDPQNGIPGKNIVLMFINERPGRVGPGASDVISFRNPDPTASRFRRLFTKLRISSKRIFITNTCIYYPQSEEYRDSPLSRKEMIFSLSILKDQIKRVQPKILIPLGNTALRGLKEILQSPELKKYQLRYNIGRSITDVRPYIFPLYHTSNRASITRPEIKQFNDWQLLNKFISVIDARIK